LNFFQKSRPHIERFVKTMGRSHLGLLLRLLLGSWLLVTAAASAAECTTGYAYDFRFGSYLSIETNSWLDLSGALPLLHTHLFSLFYAALHRY